MNIFAHLSVMEILVEIVKNNNGEIKVVKQVLVDLNHLRNLIYSDDYLSA